MRRIAAVVAVACIAMLCASRARGQMFIGGTSGYPPCAQITAQVAPVCADASEGYELYVWNGSAYTAAPTNISSLKVTGPVSLTGDSNNGSDQISRVNVNGRVAVTAYGASGAGINVTTGSVAASSDALSVGSAAGWSAGMGIIVPHAGAAETMTTPAAPTVTTIGTTGSTVYSYECVEVDAAHGYTAAGPAGSASNGPATLSNIDFERIVCPDTPATAHLNAVYQTAPGAYLVGLTSGNSIVDEGLSLANGDGLGTTAFWDIPATTAPSSAAADWLQTTVGSISGTTVTLATSATTAASAVGITHDDTAAITAAYNASLATGGGDLYFPAGDYFFCGTALSGWKSTAVGAARVGDVAVFMCPGQTFFEPSVKQYGVNIRNMMFVGGESAYHSTYTGSETDGSYIEEVRNTVVWDYTGTAIGFADADWPYWLVDHNSLKALDDNHSIGVAASGGPGIQILNNNFQNGRVGLMAVGYGVEAIGNTFIRWSGQPDPLVPRIGLWYVPGPAIEFGSALVVIANKFGNENLSGDDTHVLVADANATTGIDTSTRLPLYYAADDLSIGAGGTTLTSASECPFTAAMCQGGTGCTGTQGNWPLVLEKAGTTNINAEALTTTITAFASSCSVTVGNAAVTAVSSGGLAHFAPADTTNYARAADFSANVAFVNGANNNPLVVSTILAFYNGRFDGNTFFVGLEILPTLSSYAGNDFYDNTGTFTDGYYVTQTYALSELADGAGNVTMGGSGTFSGAVRSGCSGQATLASGTVAVSNACIEASRATVCTDNTDTTATACTAVPSAGSVTIYGNGADTVSWAQF